MSQEIAAEDQIESLVRARKTESARKAILAWLKHHKNSLRHRLRACEWYKRLGLTREAFRLIAPKEWRFSKAENDPLYRASLIWSARLLNLMGAPRYSRKILDRIPGRAPDRELACGNHYLSQYESAQALDCFQHYFDGLDKEEACTYTARLAKVSQADALNGIGKTREALAILNSISTQPHEMLLQGIIHQAQGEYWANTQEWKRAQAELTRADALIPKEDETSDRAYLLKWKAYVEAHLPNANLERIKEQFHLALRHLQRSDQKPETWLDCFALMKKVRVLSSQDETILNTYPGVPGTFYEVRCARPDFPIWVGDAQSTHVLYPARREFRIHQQSYLGYPKEIEFLEYIRRAGKYGLSLERAKSLLWPEEFAAFLQLDSRIAQLIKRIREHWGFEVKVIDRTIVGGRSLLNSVAIEYLGESAPLLPPTYLSSHPEFSTKELAKAYGLKKTTLFKALSQFESAGWIEKRIKNRKAVYKVLDRFITQIE